MTTPHGKTVCMHVALYAQVKAQAKAEGMLVRDWIERALIDELVRVRREQLRTEARIGEEQSKN